MYWIIKKLETDVEYPVVRLSGSLNSPYVRAYQFRTFTLTLWNDQWTSGSQPSVSTIMNQMYIVAESGVLQHVSAPSLSVPSGTSADSSKDVSMPGGDWHLVAYRGRMYDVDRNLYNALAVIQGAWEKQAFIGEYSSGGDQPHL